MQFSPPAFIKRLAKTHHSYEQPKLCLKTWLPHEFPIIKAHTS